MEVSLLTNIGIFQDKDVFRHVPPPHESSPCRKIGSARKVEVKISKRFQVEVLRKIPILTFFITKSSFFSPIQV